MEDKIKSALSTLTAYAARECKERGLPNGYVVIHWKDDIQNPNEEKCFTSCYYHSNELSEISEKMKSFDKEFTELLEKLVTRLKDANS